MEFATILVITAIIAGAVAGGVLRAWSLLLRVRSLENAVTQLHDRLLSETRARASNGRWSKAEIKRELETIPTKEPEPWYWGAGR